MRLTFYLHILRAVFLYSLSIWSQPLAPNLQNPPAATFDGIPVISTLVNATSFVYNDTKWHFIERNCMQLDCDQSSRGEGESPPSPLSLTKRAAQADQISSSSSSSSFPDDGHDDNDDDWHISSTSDDEFHEPRDPEDFEWLDLVVAGPGFTAKYLESRSTVRPQQTTMNPNEEEDRWYLQPQGSSEGLANSEEQANSEGRASPESQFGSEGQGSPVGQVSSPGQGSQQEETESQPWFSVQASQEEDRPIDRPIYTHYAFYRAVPESNRADAPALFLWLWKNPTWGPTLNKDVISTFIQNYPQIHVHEIFSGRMIYFILLAVFQRDYMRQVWPKVKNNKEAIREILGNAKLNGYESDPYLARLREDFIIFTIEHPEDYSDERYWSSMTRADGEALLKVMEETQHLTLEMFSKVAVYASQYFSHPVDAYNVRSAGEEAFEEAVTRLMSALWSGFTQWREPRITDTMLPGRSHGLAASEGA
ncbi:MAG: hypothetical protein M1831_002327 [Alyxoria varia]|nr:MAG: hypothetical protein M1831_002327 [Alyxoria varia]